MSATKLFLGLPVAMAVGAVFAAACSSSPSVGAFAGGVGGGSAGSAGVNSGGANGSNGSTASGLGFDAGVNDASLTEDSACAEQSAEATLTKKPVDVIIVIDNSGSMGQEIKGVQDNINQNFGQILANSGIDYRVIMVTEHGPLGPELVCIEAPLSGIPQGGCANPPAKPVNNPPIFFHYDHSTISSHNALCKLLDRYDKPDDHNEAPTGYRMWLRPEALKAFLVVTDDGVSCSYDGKTYGDGNSVNGGINAASTWDQALLALDPAQFGTEMKRNYVFYSLVALQNKDSNNPAVPWLPSDPVTTAECPTAADPGTGYQALSNLTGGLKFPLCEPMFYSTMFNEIAKGVIEGAKLNCEFAIPEAPPNLEIDLSTVSVEFTPSMGMVQKFEQVQAEKDCAPGKFWIDEQAQLIKLCPDTCKIVEADDKAKIQVLFGCKGDVN